MAQRFNYFENEIPPQAKKYFDFLDDPQKERFAETAFEVVREFHSRHSLNDTDAVRRYVEAEALTREMVRGWEKQPGRPFIDVAVASENPRHPLFEPAVDAMHILPVLSFTGNVTSTADLNIIEQMARFILLKALPEETKKRLESDPDELQALRAEEVLHYRLRKAHCGT